jgi:hypothetical protein
LAGCCECGDEPSGSGATELVQLVEQISPVTRSYRVHTERVHGGCRVYFLVNITTDASELNSGFVYVTYVFTCIRDVIAFAYITSL